MYCTKHAENLLLLSGSLDSFSLLLLNLNAVKASKIKNQEFSWNGMKLKIKILEFGWFRRLSRRKLLLDSFVHWNRENCDWLFTEEVPCLELNYIKRNLLVFVTDLLNHWLWVIYSAKHSVHLLQSIFFWTIDPYAGLSDVLAWEEGQCCSEGRTP